MQVFVKRNSFRWVVCAGQRNKFRFTKVPSRLLRKLGIINAETGQKSLKEAAMPIPMQLSRIIISEVNDQQVIYLKEIGGERTFRF